MLRQNKKTDLNCLRFCTFCFGQFFLNTCTDDLEVSDKYEILDIPTDTLQTPVNFLSDNQNFSSSSSRSSKKSIL